MKSTFAVTMLRKGFECGSRDSSSLNPRRIMFGLLVTVLALLSTVGSAQQLTGTLSGTVYDQTGAVIPKAAIVMRNAASGDIRKTEADSAGFFSITALQPATYSVVISANGFTGWQENDVVINLGDSRSLPNIKLKVGSSATEVEVIAGADAVVPLDTAEISTTLNADMIQNISLGGRDAGELLKLMPGMAFTNGGNQGSSFNPKTTGTNNGPVGAYSSNGTQPNGAMAFMLDGANLVDPGNAGTQLANINQDMVQEVKVLMSSYTAEYAKGPTIFEAFSKSGGRNFHGEAYLYARNSALNSWESYKKNIYTAAKRDSLATPELVQQLNPAESFYYYGGNVGGPVLIPFTKFNKDRKKLFFWLGYEYMNQHPSAQPVVYNVPTVAQLSGDFTNPGVDSNVLSTWGYAYSSPTNNLPSGATSSNIPVSLFDKNAVALLNAGYYPKPNVTPSRANGWNNYTYVPSTPQNRWEATGKLDYAITDNTKLTVSYSRQIENDQHPIDVWWAAPWTLPYPSNVVAATTSNLLLTNLTHSFNATTTNEFVFTLARYINPSKLANPAAVDRTKVGFATTGFFGKTTAQIPNIEGPWGGAFPNISEFSFDGGFNGGGTFGALKKDPAFYDNFTKVVGTHTLKAGFYWDTGENVQSDSNDPADNGTYNLGWGTYGTGNLVADFLLGRPGNYAQRSSIPVPDIKDHQWSIFAQDSWKATRKLTLNYGLRLDHMGQWTDGNPGIQVWDPASYVNSASAPANTGLLWHAINPAIPTSGWISPVFYPEPRVGAVYDLFGTGKTVLRGGFAVFRYQVSSGDACNGCGGPLGSFSYQTPTGFMGYANNTTGFTPPSSTSQNGADVHALQKGDDRTPQTMDWNATVSQALPWRSVFEISYVGNKSTDEILNGGNGKIGDANNILPGSFFQKDPVTGQYVSPSFNNNIFNYPIFNSSDFRPLRNYGEVYVISHGSYANYNSLQTSWQKQSGPVTFLTNFTFSKVLGIRDGQTSNGAGNGSMTDPFVLRNNYGPLAYDHTEIFNVAYVWRLPKPIHGSSLLGEMVNGWEFSGYSTFQRGAPLEPNTGGTLNAQYPGNLPAGQEITLPNGLKTNAISASTWFGSNAYQGLVPATTCNPLSNLKSGQYFNPQCFTTPAYGKQGAPLPYIRNPSYVNNDLALFKSFRITDNQNIQFRVQAQNFLNHPLRQFGLSGNGDESLNFTIPGNLPNGNGLSATNTNATTTGTPGFTTGQRQMTFVVKYYF
jgi:hypothetical protein